MRPHYERLSALDASFLSLEAPNAHMHVAVTAILEPGPLAGVAGGIDFERVRLHLAGALDQIPRYRQRVAWEPLLRHPVWVDDAAFSLSYHLHHSALPRPGSLRQLKRLVGRLMSQKLDRSKPLWEMWVVEGLEDGRFAVITKVHHSMVDGIAGVDMLKAILSPSPEAPQREPGAWRPRPAPSGGELLAGELRRRGQLARSAAGGVAASLLHPRRAARVLADAGDGLLELARRGYRSASPTPLNPDRIGPHRHFDWLRFDLDRVKAVKRSLGGTVNDVVLATVSGAVGRYLVRHGVALSDLDFRAMIPVSTRPPGDTADAGNQVASLLARLPIDEADPARRLRRLVETTAALKASHQLRGVKLIEDAADWTATALVTGMVRLAMRRRAGNLVVTNVPGPTFPLYLHGAPLLECYPLVPLVANQALGIALISYAGGLYWGFNADRYAIRDLHDLVGDTAAAFEDLEKAAGG
jgi:diacylglycerol O-acyltransferase